MVGRFELAHFALGKVREHDLQRPQHGHRPRGALVEVLADRVFEPGHVDRAVELGHADALAERPHRLGRVAAAAQAADGEHPRIVPAGDVLLLHELQQLALAHHRVGEIEPGELDLLRVVDAQLAAEPVVQRAVVLELQRADRVGDALDRVGLPVRVVVRRVDAPLVAGAMVVGPLDAVHHRVAHVDVRRGHVDLRPQRAAAVGELAGPHPLEQVEILGDACGCDWGCRGPAR